MLHRKRAPIPARMLNRILNADIRAFHKLLVIFQKVSRNFSKNCSKNNRKLVFVRKVVQKLLEKNENRFIFGLMLKYANRTTYMTIRTNIPVEISAE